MAKPAIPVCVFLVSALLVAGCSQSSGSTASSTPAPVAPPGGGGNPPPNPPGNVTNLYASPNNFQITLRWTNPASANLSGVRVVRKTGSFPASATDGTVILNSLATTVNDSSLANGTTYYYTIFTYNSSSQYSSGMQIAAVPYPSGSAVLAKTVTSAPGASLFYSAATDAAGNVYAVGYQTGTSTYAYAPGVTAFGTNSTGNLWNPVIVKYNIAGVAQWARSLSGGSGDTVFNGVTINASGEAIVSGFQTGTGTFTYGTGVTATGSAFAPNAVVVKYNATGTAQWARTVSTGNSSSGFDGILADSTGNIYTVGYQNGTALYTYGAGVSVSGAFTGKNAVIVKYNSLGSAQWVRAASGSAASEFLGIAKDSAENVYAVGYQNGNSSFTYGSVGIAGGASGYDNSVLVKFNASGTAQWARAIVSGANQSHFNGVTIDADGNIYCAGYQYGSANYTYGIGVAVAGYSANANAVLVKYSFDGNAQWARSTSGGTGNSGFMSIGIDAGGFVYVAGYQTGTGSYYYGSYVTGTGTTSNPIVLKYSPSGSSYWGQTITGGGNDAAFNYVITDVTGNVFAAGYQYATSTYTYGIGVSAGGAVTGNNATLIKYVQ